MFEVDAGQESREAVISSAQVWVVWSFILEISETRGRNRGTGTEDATRALTSNRLARMLRALPPVAAI